MDLLRRLLPLVGINAIPVIGVFWQGWSGATALTLYWWENLIGSLLVVARIVIHRALTRKRGYQRLQLQLQSGDGPPKRRPGKPLRPPRGEQKGSFLAEFLVAACAATAIHGLLLWLVVGKLLAARPDATALRHGVLGVGAIQLAAFGLDLLGIRQRPFAWIRELAQTTVNRVTLIHLVVIVGMWVGLQTGTVGVFGPFAVLKFLADIGNLLARLGVRADPDEMPPWVAGAVNKVGPKGGDFAEYWRESKAEEKRLLAQDEQIAR
ncbi:MAG TPA: DUF6498-containing protein [Thermoanaerobaculia bacterium]|jgi:hypothetical protein|nr:DUF6498-containing protein [Thermoanaerobaculia bacterium]